MEFTYIFLFCFKWTTIYGIYVKIFNNTALIRAAMKSNTEIIQLLLAKDGIDINTTNILIKKFYNIQI